MLPGMFRQPSCLILSVSARVFLTAIVALIHVAATAFPQAMRESSHLQGTSDFPGPGSYDSKLCEPHAICHRD
jgi:hypothetical protein